ncbi:trehalose-phosphatase [Kineococcus sp. SYSU DK004]|uniref:trehalose-phosphatase n=1 Tax=Kineococcus sp. SYSU DK004 TaxID=3383125 RepID=UPI003D7C5FB2
MSDVSGVSAPVAVPGLEAFAARGRVLVALDFDGVLAPIVDDPDAARATPEAAEALRRLVDPGRTDVALVSGRDIDDLAARAQPPAGVVLVGGHGTQSSLEGGAAALSPQEAALLERLVDRVESIAATHPGVRVERKPMSVVLHTRTAERPVAQEAAEAALAGPAALPGAHALRGKEVVEIGAVPLGKGGGLRRLRERLSGDGAPVEAVFFAGDDVTDEDAFAVLDPAAGDLGVKVGEGQTAARARVADPHAVAALLAALADLRG